MDEGDNVEPISFQLALRDVQLDWYRVFGHPPPIVEYPLLRRDGDDAEAGFTAAAPPGRGYQRWPDRYCDASTAPSFTGSGMDEAACQRKCDAMACACFDIHLPTGQCRVNHLGNGRFGQASSYNFTIPHLGARDE